ncbi:MAG: UDP-N-acetylmuramate dehydrogenase [Defluviitaleaceae bacterium]|nr:UDP-N-acetylmuramate dehydrogenase [Defluviitaleaceae bacterium]
MTAFNVISPLLPEGLVLADEPMARHTSFGIGGPAEVYVTPRNSNEITKVWKACIEASFKVTVLGKGNNVLVSDDGIKGVVIVTTKMNNIHVDGNYITAGSGTNLRKLADAAYEASLGEMEFASGIPGTVGGAIYMNAGAYKHEIKDICESVTALYANGELVTHEKESLAFGYRKSRFQHEDAIITEAKFLLPSKNKDEIKAKMTNLNGLRRDSQPLDKHSAGSTFKRPKAEGMYAAKMIDDCGLKGFTIGGAQVSEKHAGFVVNIGNATAKDVLSLIEQIQDKVHQATHIWLEPEVQMIGFN